MSKIFFGVTLQCFCLAVTLQCPISAWEDHPDRDTFSLDKTIPSSGNPEDHYDRTDEHGDYDCSSNCDPGRGTCSYSPERD